MGLLDSLFKNSKSQQAQPVPGNVVINTGSIVPAQNPPTPTPVPPPVPQATPQTTATPTGQIQSAPTLPMQDLIAGPGTPQAATPTSSPNKTQGPPSFADTFKSMFFNKSKANSQGSISTDPTANIDIPHLPSANTPLSPTQTVTQGITDVKDIIAPSSIVVDFNNIQIGSKYYRTYFAQGYPAYVESNWLSPIINFEHPLKISTFYYPVDSAVVLQKLKRKIGEMEATIYGEMESGKVLDPKVKATLESAHTLQEKIAKGEGKYFHFAVYITIQANSKKELETIGKAVEATMAAIGIGVKPTTLQMEQGFESTLPTSNDQLFLTRNMDTSALASTFPFVTSELTMSDGVLFGINKHNKSLIIFDRFQMENANTVVFARSGAGKSYVIKLEAIRSLMLGSEVIVIDPEREYEDLSRAMDGDYITFSQDTGAKINPFDIAEYEKSEGRDALRAKILMLHSFFNILFGGLTNIEKGILDRAMILSYKEKGITTDPDTQNQEPPLMEDLFKVLQGMAEEEAHALASRLERFMRGSAAGIFNKPTNIQFKNRLTVFSLRDLQEELRPMAMFIMLDFIWTKVRNDMKRRILIVEEAWYMMQNLDSARFMYSMAKRARKYFLGITTISQDVEDFLLNDFGRAVVTNSSIQILMKQSTAAIDRVQAVFGLSEGEKSFLLNAEVGEGLFFAGRNHVAIQVVSSTQEHLLITTNPQDLARS